MAVVLPSAVRTCSATPGCMNAVSPPRTGSIVAHTEFPGLPASLTTMRVSAPPRELRLLTFSTPPVNPTVYPPSLLITCALKLPDPGRGAGAQAHDTNTSVDTMTTASELMLLRWG